MASLRASSLSVTFRTRTSWRWLLWMSGQGFSSLLTLPERVLCYGFLRRRRSSPDQLRAPVFILGYYRSGTTHLQYLLSRDPNFFSPAWIHTLVPQGFVLTWTFLRFFLIPFMPSTRQVDPMLFGPDAPSEDDFALNN